ncbi:hypothetical protein BS47DRAFT_28770 [Hydnum rufescens UP504]|uniref:Uncharacterized protein n=1 Tax=Hydnum rufescens UP504 TaxID=1448309 RepID=A0A9P6DZC4_9AGAM|nr:hypothetical protein BS47DRAFT_28770 [Hydnum rufescens UP504]
MSSEVVTQTAFLMVARIGLFQFCRTYLLRSLVQDLRHLSAQTAPSPSSSAASASIFSRSAGHSINPSHSPPTASSDDDDEGAILPGPATAPYPPTPSSPSKAPPLSTSSLFFRRTPRISKQASSSLSDARGTNNNNNTFHSRVSRSIFALCFSESCTLFLLVIFQTTEFLSHQ